MRGGHAADHAFRRGEEPGAAGRLMLRKTRDLLVRQRTALINALRAHLAEYGKVTATGPGGLKALTKLLHEEQDDLPEHARSALASVVFQLEALNRQIDHLEGEILAWHRADETSRRLATIPGIGPPPPSPPPFPIRDSSDLGDSLQLGSA